jgi:hypothetical protein
VSQELHKDQILKAVFPFDFRMMRSHMQNYHQCMARQLLDVSNLATNQQSMHRLMWARNWSQPHLQPQKAAILRHFLYCTILIWLHTSSLCMSCSNVPQGPVKSPSLINQLMSRRLSSLTQHQHRIEKARYKLMMHLILPQIRSYP